MKEKKPKPFIKWVGGKTSILGSLNNKIKDLEFDTYVEPFLGGGALFIDLISNRPDIKNFILSDMNQSLINTYNAVFSNIDILMPLLEQLKRFYDIAEDKEKFYKDIRTLYNKYEKDNVGSAAFLIFLNKAGFNGLYRENKKGAFNTPWGKKAKFNYDSENMKDLNNVVQDKNIVLKYGDFVETLDISEGKRLYYIDPPYAPITKGKDFTSYTKEKFLWEDQGRVLEFCNIIDKSGGYFMMSNSIIMKDIIIEKYPYFKIDSIENKRIISGLKEGRERVEELLVTNF